MTSIDDLLRLTRVPVVVLALSLGFALPALANHPVLVEGETDFDGDGRLGVDEDLDGDQLFGSIGAALGGELPGAANQNGKVIIVTSGRFIETVVITAANGNVTVEAAPGVEADIDAVMAGLPGNDVRQLAPGIVIDAPENRRVTLRNLEIRNWTSGILVKGFSHVAIDGCRIENNIQHGILAAGKTRVAVTDTHINATGARISPVAATEPNPGNGLTVARAAKVLFADGTITGSLGAGIANLTGKKSNLRVRRSNVFDNLPNFLNSKKAKDFPDFEDEEN